jgi:hypothetical protein
MPMNGNARGDVDYNAITALNPNMGVLSPAEVSKLRHAFEVLFSADTGYIQEYADVLPAGSPNTGGLGLESAAAIPGEVTSGPGSGGTTVTTASEPLIGTGSIV